MLEIGPGTGQATRGLLAEGWSVVALEPGPALARVARRVLAGLGPVEIVTDTFEQWPAEDASFNLVFAATSWHWLDPTVAYPKASRLLRPGGSLAIVATAHVLPERGDTFFRQVQQVYDAVGMGDGLGGPLPPEAIEAPDVPWIEDSGLFEPPTVRRYVSEYRYSAAEYLDLLGTYSGHIAAGARQREILFADIRRLIEGHPSGAVRKHYLHLLQTARRAA